MIKLSIIYNSEKESAINIYKELLEFLKSKKEFEILDEENLHKASYIVTIGGDGTLLRAFRNIKNKKAKIIPINSGTLGYLTEIRKDKYKEIFENILKNHLCNFLSLFDPKSEFSKLRFVAFLDYLKLMKRLSPKGHILFRFIILKL